MWARIAARMDRPFARVRISTKITAVYAVILFVVLFATMSALIFGMSSRCLFSPLSFSEKYSGWASLPTSWKSAQTRALIGFAPISFAAASASMETTRLWW